MSDDRARNSATILVVDDEQSVRGLMARWLADAGYQCLTAGDAPEAWQCLQEHEVDLVTTDINMPGQSGIDLLRQITPAFPDLGVIMLTANGDSDTAIGALTAGACGYLIKPVLRTELLFHVTRALERRQLILENRQHTLDLERRVLELTMAVRRAHEETIHRLLAAAMFHDDETGAHVRRTGLFGEVLAVTAGWPDSQVEDLRLAAPMHDIGKIGIPDAILRKPGSLTEAEFEVMKSHTTLGANMLAGSDWPVLKLGCQIALNHHERWDGLGYPAGRKETAIPECARIVAIVDVYDALTHNRVYRPALPEAEALVLMEQGRGTHFDPRLLYLFFQALPEIRGIAREYPDDADSELLDRAYGLEFAETDNLVAQPAIH